MEEIKAWLAAADKSYWRGVELVEKHGSSLSLVAQLRRKENRANLERINYELTKLAGVDYVPLEETKTNVPVVFTKESEGEGGDLVRELTQTRAEKYAERAKLSDMLADLKDEALKEATAKVVAIDEEIIALSTQIRYVGQHGRLPEKLNVEDELTSLKTRKTRLGEKASRLRGKLKTNPGNLDNQAELDATVAEMEQLELQIRALQQAPQK